MTELKAEYERILNDLGWRYCNDDCEGFIKIWWWSPDDDFIELTGIDARYISDDVMSYAKHFDAREYAAAWDCENAECFKEALYELADKLNECEAE